jgi:hypothetical protein
LEKFPQGSRWRESIERCILNCETLLDDLSILSEKAIRVYTATANQLLVAGMGAVLGINHLAIHEYMRMCGWEGLEYRIIFEKVVEMDGIARSFRDKYESKTSAGTRPRAPQSQGLDSRPALQSLSPSQDQSHPSPEPSQKIIPLPRMSMVKRAE